MSILDMLKTRVALANAPGTYAAMWPTRESHQKLQDHFSQYIDDLVEDFHVTTTYSRKPLKLKNAAITIRLKPADFSYDMFGESKNVLVLKVKHPLLDKLWQKAIDKGATWDHDEYSPHISLCSSYKGGEDNLPPLPKFDILLTHYKVEELKED